MQRKDDNYKDYYGIDVKDKIITKLDNPLIEYVLGNYQD